ncbi:hypothetical protein CFOL_v3_19429 [Cephalotus follicularis]|uniref:Uncharacterized protein n=1 Tax=Cephalotus follicularis TaxID=3775 RepID=A0A1Q3C795_CEPFO|nr:hypothetical protein CFOL_v3_19429 [Cephalotus follicularis]
MMDIKSLAKSKRAHTQQHSKKPNLKQKPKAPAGSSSDAGGPKKLSSGNPIREKTHKSQHVSALPSNWDCYEEPSADQSSQASDVVLPKSKGADYLHLITEAQSQSLSYSPMDCFPSLDDVLPGGFSQGIGSLLSVRGEGILSWIADDNFIVEDRTTASHEASFFSLNLNALAEQLEKVDLPSRLFIESDLLPPELLEEGSKANNDQETEVSTTITEELVNDFSEKVIIADQTTEIASSGSGCLAISDPGSGLVDPIEDVTNASQFGKSDQSGAMESTVKLKVAEELSTFEATAAEAELDMLLDSFSETKILDSTGTKSVSTFPDSQREASIPLPQPFRKGPDLSKTAIVTANFDDVLDDSHVKTTPHALQSSSSHSVTKSKVLEDFDSWLDTI